jgi:hypothetical protein
MGDGHPFWSARGRFFCAFGWRTCDIEDGRGGTGAGCTDGAGFRVRGDEEEVWATGTHFGVLAAGLFARSARGWMKGTGGAIWCNRDVWLVIY